MSLAKPMRLAEGSKTPRVPIAQPADAKHRGSRLAIGGQCLVTKQFLL